MPFISFMIHHFGPSNTVVAISSWNPEKSARNWIFTKFSLDSHRCNAPNEKLASGPQQEPFTSVVPVSLANLCVVYPTAPLKVLKTFGWKLFKTRLEMGSNRRSSDWFSTEIMQFCTGEGCPLPNTLVGIMPRFDFEMQTPWFSHSSDSGSIPNTYLTVRWNRLWIFILIQLHSASQLSTFAHFAVLERHRVKFRVQNATVGGDGDDDSWFMNHD